MAEPWVERHRPRRLDQILGNPQALSDLRKWAEAWRDGRPREKAVLLAGPPGCGKTSAAHALAAEFGWELVELNASDARSAPAIQRVAGVGAAHETFSSAGEYHSSRAGRRKLIVLDEADNLYERASGQDESVGEFSDRGGKRAIVDTVAAARQPIVLIANDAYELTRGSGDRLGRLTLKIPFRRPPAASVRKLLAHVAAQEGVSVSDDVLHALSVRSQGDLRSALNDLEALAAGRTRVETLGELAWGERNRSESAFDAVAAILKGTDARKAIDAARELDETPDFLLLWIDENLPAEYREPHDLARAYDRLSRADVLLGRTIRRQQFALWGYATELMAGGVAVAKDRPYGTPPRYQFPGWLRMMGATKGSRGVRARLGLKLGRFLHVGRDAALRDEVPPLRAACLRDAALAESIAFRLDLDEAEVRELLGPEAPAALVDEVLAHVERRRGAGATEQAELAVHPGPPPAAPEKPSRHRGTRLGDF